MLTPSAVPLVEHVLPPEQQKTALFLQENIFSNLPEKHFLLAGGTALALKYGHRQSIDFDFFSFPQQTLHDPLIKDVDNLFRQHGIYQRKDIEFMAGQVHYRINNVAVLFSVFQNFSAEHEDEFYKLPIYKSEKIHGFNVLSTLDLAGMKAFARCHRSKMKDMVDLSEILHHDISLQEIIVTAEKQFGYDISGKEILNHCLNRDDIQENLLDEPIVYLNNHTTSYYMDFLKEQALKIYADI